jgi:hypothetical protein
VSGDSLTCAADSVGNLRIILWRIILWKTFLKSENVGAAKNVF